MNLEQIDIVLVRPARAGNIAAACRAMANMGLTRLCLVGRPEGLEQPEARALAYGAWPVLDAARSARDLPEAVADSAFVVGTSARLRPGAWTPRQLARRAGALVGDGRLAVVFGPEASGLRQDELRLCHAQVTVPTRELQPSLNLAQAVLVIAYELSLATRATRPAEGPARARVHELEAVFEDLARALLKIGYLQPANPDRILAELRRLAARARPTRREVALLRGLARQLAWAAERIARPPARDG